MPDNSTLYKKLINTRLLKSNGSWIYCNSCNNTVGYLCYSTYDYFKMSFTCKCGKPGSIEISKGEANGNPTHSELTLKKGRFCCPVDQSPLFSVVEKNLEKYEYKIVCKSCLNDYEGHKYMS